MKPIYFFLKFFQERGHAEAFLAGRLYMNPLKYFKELEDGEDGRADPHEGPFAWHQSHTLGSIQVGPILIHPSELAAPLVIQDTATASINVLCLYAATSPFKAISSDNVDAFRQHLRVPDRCHTMGPLAVLVHSSGAFIQRVTEAATSQRLALQGGLVDYFDPESFSGMLARPVFAKKKEFSWQREYRLAIDRRAASPVPFTFDVGPLDDICAIVDSAALGDVTVIPPA